MRQRGDGQTDQTLVYGEPDKPTDRNEGADEQIRGKNRLIIQKKKKKILLKRLKLCKLGSQKTEKQNKKYGSWSIDAVAVSWNQLGKSQSKAQKRFYKMVIFLKGKVSRCQGQLYPVFCLLL